MRNNLKEIYLEDLTKKEAKKYHSLEIAETLNETLKDYKIFLPSLPVPYTYENMYDVAFLKIMFCKPSKDFSDDWVVDISKVYVIKDVKSLILATTNIVQIMEKLKRG